MSLLTIFTAPKSFTNPHIATIQRNAIRSWLELGPEVEVLVIGDEPGIAETCAELGARHLPAVGRNEQGTPLVSAIFDLARRNSTSPLLGYVNADVILLPDVIEASRRAMEQAKHFLLVGQRWDLGITTDLDFSAGWQSRLQERLRVEGRLHPRGGSDYFIYPREQFANMPAFAVGRAGWDNWMIYEARCRGWAVADATEAVQIIHQDHDYSHLPNGQPHYRLPETFENVRLAGGKLTIFKLDDANRRLTQDGRLRPMNFSWAGFRRGVEVFPLVALHSMPLGWAFFALFHPKKAYAEFRKRRGSRISRIDE